VIHRQVGQHFAIEADAAFLDLSHKLGIGHAMESCPCVDPLDPQRTKISFLRLAIAVSINQSLLYRILRYGPYILLAAKESLGQFEDALAPHA